MFLPGLPHNLERESHKRRSKVFGSNTLFHSVRHQFSQTAVRHQGGWHTMGHRIDNVTLLNQHGDAAYVAVLPANRLVSLTRVEQFSTTSDGVNRMYDADHAIDNHILTTARGINALLMLLVSSPNFRGTIGEDFGVKSLSRGLQLARSFNWSSDRHKNENVPAIVVRLDQSIGRNRAKQS